MSGHLESSTYLYCGQYPFSGDNNYEIGQHIINDPFRPFPPEFTRLDIKQLIFLMLIKDPSMRINMEDLGFEVSKLLMNELEEVFKA